MGARLLTLLLAAGLGAGASTPDIRVVAAFGAQPADVAAVARSAAGTIWRHCPDTRLAGPGIDLFRNGNPVTAHDRSAEGRVRIGLATENTYWSQYAFQFAHELAHALARHTREPAKAGFREHRPNLWLEEAICETASLFALRAMAVEWKASPPYPHWASYAPSLAAYAQQRLDASAKDLPAGKPIGPWLRANEPALRKDSVIRELNNVVASRLLPVFESEPSGWEAVSYLNLGRRGAEKGLSLADHLADWRATCPPRHKAFVTRLAAALDVRLR